MPRKATTQKVTGRPENRTAKETRPTPGASRAVERPVRNVRPMGDFRDELGLTNKDPNKVYHWFLSKEEFDKRIYDALNAGWQFVDATKEKNLIPGEYAVKTMGSAGSLFRKPAGRSQPGQYLYLMWMSKEDHDYVQKIKQDRIDEQERQIFEPDRGQEKGQYGPGANVGWEERYKLD